VEYDKEFRSVSGKLGRRSSMLVNGEVYYMRKGDFTIKGLVICDESARLTWVEMGWPGSILIRRSICLVIRLFLLPQ